MDPTLNPKPMDVAPPNRLTPREAAAAPLEALPVAPLSGGNEVMMATDHHMSDHTVATYHARLANTVVDALQGLSGLTALELTFFDPAVVAEVSAGLPGVQVPPPSPPLETVLLGNVQFQTTMSKNFHLQNLFLLRVMRLLSLPQCFV